MRKMQMEEKMTPSSDSSREQFAKDLAQKHYEIEEGITDIFRISDRIDVEVVPSGSGNLEPIKLLEVNQNTVPSGIMPIQFGQDVASGILFPSIIIEVTPEEYQAIQNGRLVLPDGWSLGDRIPALKAGIVE